MRKATFPYLKTLVIVFGVLLLATNVALAQVSVSMPSIQARVGISRTISLEVGTLPRALSVLSYQGAFTYDSTVLRITGYTAVGTISETADLPIVNFSTAGIVQFAVASDSALSGSGALLSFTADILATGTSPLDITTFTFNEGNPAAVVTDGQVVVPTFSVSLPTGDSLSSPSAGTFLIPIKADALTGRGILSYQFTVSYDTTVLTITGIDKVGTSSAGFTVMPNASVHGQITVAAASSSTELVGESGAVLINLVGKPLVTGTSWATSALTFSNAQFNEGDPAAGWIDGSVVVKNTDGISVIDQVPTQYVLDQNYPNPFNPTTMITFGLPKQSNVTLEVYNILGMKVRTLIAGERMNAAKYSVDWDGKDDSGMSVSSGVYLYRLQTDGFNAAKKMVLMK